MINQWVPAPHENPHGCMYCGGSEPRLGPYHEGPAHDVPGTYGQPTRYVPYTCTHCFRAHAAAPGSPIHEQVATIVEETSAGYLERIAALEGELYAARNDADDLSRSLRSVVKEELATVTVRARAKPREAA